MLNFPKMRTANIIWVFCRQIWDIYLIMNVLYVLCPGTIAGIRDNISPTTVQARKILIFFI